MADSQPAVRGHRLAGSSPTDSPTAVRVSPETRQDRAGPEAQRDPTAEERRPRRVTCSRRTILGLLSPAVAFVAGTIVGCIYVRLERKSHDSSSISLPPYGIMARDFGSCPRNKSLADLHEKLAASLSGLPSDAWAATRLWHGREQEFEKMLLRIERQLEEEFLSLSSTPEFSPSPTSPAGREKQKLWQPSETLEELHILKRMEPQRQARVVYLPNGLTGNGVAWPNVSHLHLFSNEDREGTAVLRLLLELATGDGWRDEYSEAAITCGHIALRLKDRFQRPRPYQAALLMASDITPHLAETAQTPSFPSGHALQAYCVVAAVLNAVASTTTISPGLTALMRLAHDIGDRRVLAGVHYPSDNYASAVVFNELTRAGAWPSSNGLRFGRTSKERAMLCNGETFPEMCLDPHMQPGLAFEI